MYSITKIEEIESIISKNMAVSLDLIEKIDPEQANVNIILDNIFNCTASLAASMKTKAGRYSNADQMMVHYLSELPPPVKILDVGASNGITTLDLVRLLDDPDTYKVVSSDLVAEVETRRWKNWKLIAHKHPTTGQHTWLQAQRGSLLVSKRLGRKKFGKRVRLLNRILVEYVDRVVWKSAVNDTSFLAVPESTASLLHPIARQAVRNGQMEYCQKDMFRLGNDNHDCIRAMTVGFGLPKEAFGRFLASAHGSLTQQGFFMLGFGKDEGTLFRKTGTGFDPVQSLEKQTRHYEQVCAFSAHDAPN